MCLYMLKLFKPWFKTIAFKKAVQYPPVTKIRKGFLGNIGDSDNVQDILTCIRRDIFWWDCETINARNIPHTVWWWDWTRILMVIWVGRLGILNRNVTTKIEICLNNVCLLRELLGTYIDLCIRDWWT